MAHILTVTRPEGWDALPNDEREDNDWEFDMSCDGVNCDLWRECDGVHLTRHDDDSRSEDGVVEHGVEHKLLDGMWCEPANGCGYQINAMDSDTAWEIAQKHGVGRYEVDIEWGDWGSAYLIDPRKLDVTP